MPELPEVETIVRDLRHQVMGKIITGLILRAKALNSLVRGNPDRFYQGIMNQTVLTVLRKGKYIILPLANSNVLVFHLGMTGRLLIKESPNVGFDEQLSGNEYVDKHTHMLLELTDPSDAEVDLELHFNDVRLFGKVWLLEDVNDIEVLDIPGLRDLGPDAIGISYDDFAQMITCKRSIKASLLDQSKIAGVGNIYADEACFVAGIHPATRGSVLTEEQLLRLWFSIKTVLKKGIRYRGSSTSDYTTTDGSKGSFQDHHKVYRKTGQECTECGSVITRIKVVGRSTHLCPTCQPER
jgi:formamidopyrimidine-DNA glycosylase